MRVFAPALVADALSVADVMDDDHRACVRRQVAAHVAAVQRITGETDLAAADPLRGLPFDLIDATAVPSSRSATRASDTEVGALLHYLWLTSDEFLEAQMSRADDGAQE